MTIDKIVQTYSNKFKTKDIWREAIYLKHNKTLNAYLYFTNAL